MEKFDPIDGACFFDSTHNELDTIVGLIEARIDDWASNRDFDAVDIPSMRASIAILIALLERYDVGYLLPLSKVDDWAKKIDEPFHMSGRWGFTPWPETEREEYRESCRSTLSTLRHLVAKHEK